MCGSVVVVKMYHATKDCWGQYIFTSHNTATGTRGYENSQWQQRYQDNLYSSNHIQILVAVPPLPSRDHHSCLSVKALLKRVHCHQSIERFRVRPKGLGKTDNLNITRGIAKTLAE